MREHIYRRGWHRRCCLVDAESRLYAHAPRIGLAGYRPILARWPRLWNVVVLNKHRATRQHVFVCGVSCGDRDCGLRTADSGLTYDSAARSLRRPGGGNRLSLSCLTLLLFPQLASEVDMASIVRLFCVFNLALFFAFWALGTDIRLGLSYSYMLLGSDA